MCSQHSLRFYIENKRQDMIKAAENFGMNAEITIKHSQELDELLNQYWRVVFETNENPVVKFS
ncbi:aspartyl-phosphate phosphatase Spo0E family protein [Anaerobacillus sp. CMMVII]|uniref:aspartyl-phosphate phosphatase Spo0E family protein n=1 Tax=Anaerobacillus sp. CMMVII TaxID=2755588 RepID=UPI0021B7E227|nr:aspartyl-phosphate phosphatase Spo0E family protein [Anaerobacillus sp. CMMVII]MCT8139370.1 aspartyl-phosphate phosphatase Spo0E family protein [Anaerobacillus sp. CMMVII]